MDRPPCVLGRNKLHPPQNSQRSSPRNSTFLSLRRDRKIYYLQTVFKPHRDVGIDFRPFYVFACVCSRRRVSRDAPTFHDRHSVNRCTGSLFLSHISCVSFCYSSNLPRGRNSAATSKDSVTRVRYCFVDKEHHRYVRRITEHHRTVGYTQISSVEKRGREETITARKSRCSWRRRRRRRRRVFLSRQVSRRRIDE